MLRNFFPAMALALSVLAAASPCAAAEPTYTGEKAHYAVSWSGISAGTAVLSAESVEEGKNRFTATAKTNSGVGFLYPLDITYQSTVGPSFESILFTTKGTEGWGDPVEKRVEFSPDERVSKYYSKGKLKNTVEVTPDVLDPISVLYFFRQNPLPEPGGEIAFKVADGKRVANGKLKALAREKVKTPLGEFSTIKVEPEMKGVRGIFGKSPNSHMYIWFTDDPRRLMVKMLSEVSVGSFTALLEKISSPQPPQASQAAP